MKKEKEELPDEMNPELMFNMTASALLIDIAIGKINATELAKKALTDRGCNDKGE